MQQHIHLQRGCTTASARKLKKLENKHRESIRIYTGAFRISLVKALHVEANNPSLELRRNKLGLRFLYKLKSNTSFMDTKYIGQQRGTKRQRK